MMTSIHTRRRATIYRQMRSLFANHIRAVMATLVMSLLLIAIAIPVITISSRANSLTPTPQAIAGPTNLVVTAVSNTAISLSWSAPAGTVEYYEIERSESASQPFVLFANAEGTIFTDNSVQQHQAYLYRVRAVERTSTCTLIPSEPSNMAMGAAVSFEFSQPQGQIIKAQQFYDVRNAVNAVRKVANLPAASWLRATLNNLQIKTTDVQEMRDRLAEALNVLNIPVGTYTDPTLSAGTNATLIRGVHIEQLQTKSTRGVSSGPGRPAALADRATLGEFAPVKNLQLTPVHISVLPNERVLFWGRDRFKNAAGTAVIEETKKSQAYLLNTATNEETPVPNSTTNLFCSGHSFLPDGRLLVTGGHRDPNPDAGDGEPHINLFDFQSSSWVRGAEDMNKGRWYPYNVMLGSGKTLIVSGAYFKTPGVPLSQTINTQPQIYNPGTGCLENLADTGQDYLSAYPFLHLRRSDGKVLQIQSPYPLEGEHRNSKIFDPANPPNGPWPDFASTNDDHGLGSSVLFDSGRKALVLGGFNPAGSQPNNQAEYINLETPNGTWTRVAPMNFKRAYHTATILPDGKVLVTGGVSCPGGNNIDCVDRAAMNAEMWEATNFNETQPTNLRWRTMARYSEVRAYHSVAVLLPDATVLVGGGGRPGAIGEFLPNTMPNTDCRKITNNNVKGVDARLFGHANYEIYSPPYLFTSSGNLATRPVITSVPKSISYGQTFTVETSGAGAAPKVSLVRLGSVTHGFNQDQRQVFLGESPDVPLQVFSSEIRITFTTDSNKLPPGYYMLFVINGGVPSVAKIVRVGDTSIFLTEAPNTTAFGEGSTWEQGVEFSSSVNGQITHIRYWKAPEEPAGNHVGRIWTATGTQLATAPFMCETASGWQTAPLSTPLQISAGVKYRVTYNVHQRVAKTFNALDNGPITSGVFTAWRSWFSTPAGSFPTRESGSNLFADVVFRPTQ